ncbi:MAG: hypothetical protein EAZ89_19900 [Bacteroidetes bacterium]|jgi:hypothetical protein|nr:MAG: hypothetical protein EAZ89_19900 [Bacteroidota bacterium]
MILMKKLFRYLLLLSLPLLATSCLTIEESYTFKNNGSGSMQYLVDLGDLGPMIAMNSEEGGEDAFKDFDFAQYQEQLEAIEGISKVSAVKDKEAYHFGINFSFRNIEALNKALNLILRKDNTGPEHVFFTREGNIITRKHAPESGGLPEELSSEDEEGESALAMLEQMKYRVKMNFAQPVEAVYAGVDAQIGGKKDREVLVEGNFRQLAENSELLSSQVVLRK